MLLRDYADALEADFQRFYHLDLLDLYRGKLTPRRVKALAINLPPGAQVWLEMSSDNAWSVTDYILADLIDVQVAKASEKKQDPYPRPSDARDKKEQRQKMIERASRFKQRHQDQ